MQDSEDEDAVSNLNSSPIILKKTLPKHLNLDAVKSLVKLKKSQIIIRQYDSPDQSV